MGDRGSGRAAPRGASWTAFAAGALRISGLAAVARALLVGRGTFVLELHGVASRCRPELPREAQPEHSAEDLKRILEWLSVRFRFLSPAQLEVPDRKSSRPGVLLTFDDGFSNLRTIALPLLEQHGAPAVFFVTTQHVIDPKDWLSPTRRRAEVLGRGLAAVSDALVSELYDGLSATQLRECARSPHITIGAHTSTHPSLTHCSASELERELSESKRFLEQVTGQPVDLLAYPFGDYDRRVADAARRAGYRGAFAEERLGVTDPAFEIPRVGLYRSTPAYLSAKLSGLHRRPLGPVGLPPR